MSRKYSQELLDKIIERQEIVNIKGAEVLVKKLPDSDERGAMNPRLYKDMKKQITLMKFMPKSLLKMNTSPKSIGKLRKMFGEIKSNSIVEKTDTLAISVDYRLCPENPYPTGHEDCYSVLKWIYDNTESLGGNKNNIFVAGDSAGGNLTQYCTTKDMEQGLGMVKGQLLLYPTLNMAKVEDEFFKWSRDEYEIAPKYKAGIEMILGMFEGLSGDLGEILGTTDIKNEYLSPYIREPKGLPPTFITVGEHDFLKVESLAYSAKLTKAGVETKTVLYKGLGHAYGDNVGVYPQSEDCAIEMGNFILKYSR